jgi:hypothetical protein
MFWLLFAAFPPPEEEKNCWCFQKTFYELEMRIYAVMGGHNKT